MIHEARTARQTCEEVKDTIMIDDRDLMDRSVLTMCIRRKVASLKRCQLRKRTVGQHSEMHQGMHRAYSIFRAWFPKKHLYHLDVLDRPVAWP